METSEAANSDALEVQHENIPQSLRDRPQWVCWSGEMKGDKLTKIPKCPRTGYNASHSNPKHWGTYEEARQAHLNNARKYRGIGYVFHEKDPYCGIDLDNCRDPKTGNFDQWAVKILQKLNSYAEVSPSGTGVKIFVRAELPGGARKNDRIEMYSCKRFFTITGVKVGDAAEPVERQEAVDELYKEYFGTDDDCQRAKPASPNKPSKSCTPPSFEPEEIQVGDVILRPDAEPPPHLLQALLEVDPKFKATWELNRPDLKDQSQSSFDLSLATQAALAGWSPQETADLIIAFRRKTGDQPEKALRADYMLTGKFALIPKVLEDVQKCKDNQIRELVDEAISKNNPRILFDNIEQLVQDSVADYAKARTVLKGHFGAKLSLGLLDKAVKEARIKLERKKVQESEIPTIQINLRQHREVVKDACAVLEATNSKSPKIFYRSGEIVTITTDERDRVVIAPVGESCMRLIITRCADFVSETQSGFTPTMPPKELLHSVLSNKEFKLPPLNYVTTTPILAGDGRIIDTPGYDKNSGVYFHPVNGIPTIPEKPNKGDGLQAARFLADELFHDLPFEDRAEPGRRTEANFWSPSLANLMALFITPVVRLMVKRVPIAVITAPIGGHAKTLTAEIIARVATGKAPGLKGLPPNAKDEEVEKLIASSLRSGTQFTVLDNIEGRLRSPALCRAVTAEIFSSRLLGTNTTLELPVATTWVVTGNNIVLVGDLPRRAYWIRLNAKVTAPHLREGFKHKNLEKWVEANRQQLVGALLTMVKAWVEAGMPPAGKLPVFGGFQEWVQVVGGVLNFCGVKGFLDNLIKNLRDDDSEEWEEFLSVWLDEHQVSEHGRPIPITVNQLIETIFDKKTFGRLRNALPLGLADYLDSPTRGFRRRVGLALKAKEQVRFGDRALYLQREPQVDRRSGAAGWVVCEGNVKNE